jgi:hypothetical protein
MLGIDKKTEFTYDCRRLTEPAVTPLAVLLMVAVALNIVKHLVTESIE